MKRYKPFITSIFGNSRSGKTTLAKSIDTYNEYLYIDCSELKDDLMIDSHLDKNLLNKGRPEVLFNKLRYIDPKVAEIRIKELDDNNIFEAVLIDGSIVPINKISKKYFSILIVILLLRNKKNVILDNFDSLFIGSNNKHIYNMIIKEMDINNTKNILTFTDVSLWQSFSLSIPLEMGKKFVITGYDAHTDTYDNLILDYKKLAYTVNFIYDKSIKRSMEENRPMRPSDSKEL